MKPIRSVLSAGLGIAIGMAVPFTNADAAQRIVAPFPEIGVSVPNRFGHAVAASGEWLAIGAPGEDVPSVSNAGVAYVYRLNGPVYELVSRLVASDAGSNDEFGSPSGSGAGSAYVFERSGSAPTCSSNAHGAATTSARWSKPRPADSPEPGPRIGLPRERQIDK